MTNLCDMGALFVDNCLPDGTFRFHADGEDFGQMCLLGTFSQRSVVSEHSCVKIDDDLPLETVALVGCGVPTGWGTAVNAGGVRPGDTTVIYGIGGVGINAVQGAAFAGARNVIAVDPLEFKRENAMEFGADARRGFRGRRGISRFGGEASSTVPWTTCPRPSRSSASISTSPPGSPASAVCSSPRRWRSLCGGTGPGARLPGPPVTDRRAGRCWPGRG